VVTGSAQGLVIQLFAVLQPRLWPELDVVLTEQAEAMTRKHPKPSRPRQLIELLCRSTAAELEAGRSAQTGTAPCRARERHHHPGTGETGSLLERVELT